VNNWGQSKIKCHQGRTASYPTVPSQIPASGITAPGFSTLFASHMGLPSLESKVASMQRSGIESKRPVYSAAKSGNYTEATCAVHVALHRHNHDTRLELKNLASVYPGFRCAASGLLANMRNKPLNPG